MIITSTGKTIKINASSVSILGKGARGVRIVNIESPDYVIGLDKVVSEGVPLKELDAEAVESVILALEADTQPETPVEEKAEDNSSEE